MNSELVKELSEDLRDWYWNFGARRRGSWSLSRAIWLAGIERALSSLSDVFKAEEQYKRPAVALWGPSQSGKSTLLASFIDYEFEKTGGALGWGAKPFRFVLAGGKGDALNPNNRGSDASGCVTRYVMRETVPFPETPVEIEFATEREILMSLAFGYLSEMDGKNKEGERVYFDGKKIRDFLGGLREESRGVAAIDRQIFERLNVVLDVVDSFFLSEEGRFLNLRPRWDEIRQDILCCDELLSKENFERFVSWLFWDELPEITDVYHQLLDQSKALKKEFSDKKIYASLEVASLLLDISAPCNDEARSRVPNIICEELNGGNAVAFRMKSTGTPSSRSFFNNDTKHFANVQGLVAALVVPLRADVIKQANKALFDLLCDADIVDFPGVANEDRGANDALLTSERLREEPLLALTKIVKRGKTASIVIGYARNLNLDLFALLVRMNKYSPKNNQLRAGVDAWYSAMLGNRFSDKNGRELPLAIVQTFSAELINSLKQKRNDKNGLKNIFDDKLSSLGALGDPNNVSFYAVNYPQFQDGKIATESEDELMEIVEEIEKDVVFLRYYGETKDSLREMCGLSGIGGNDGGRSFLFAKIHEQVKKSIRPRRLEKKKEEQIGRIVDLVKSGLPPEGDESSERAILIARVRDAVVRNADNGARRDKIEQKIREIYSLRPEKMERVPMIGARGLKPIEEYAERLYMKIRESIKTNVDSDFGLFDSQERDRFATCLADRVSTEKLTKWLGENVEADATVGDREKIRQPLAMKVYKLLSAGTRGFSGDVSLDSLPDFAKKGLLGQFLSSLFGLEQESLSERGMQPGDDRLTDIYSKIQA